MKNFLEKEKKVFEIIFENNSLKVEIGEIAQQANGSVLIRYKDTVVLSVSVLNNKPSNLDFFPLNVIYQEKLYAAGKIPGGFLRREGRPSDHEILISRLIDRSLRPLFSKNFNNEVQVINTVLSSNLNFNSETTSLFGSSLSLLISEIPFFEPVSGVCVAKIEDKLIINPNLKEREKSEFHLLLSGTKENINMIELCSKEIDELDLLEAIKIGHESIKKLCLFQEKIQKLVGKKKIELLPQVTNDKLKEEITHTYLSQIKSILKSQLELDNNKKITLKNLKEQIIEEYKQKNFIKKVENVSFFDFEAQKNYLIEVSKIFDFLSRKEIRKMILDKKIRPDGRKPNQIRQLSSTIDILPRTHGSSLFTRGNTQSLAIVTLGTLRESKIIDDLSNDVDKRFMLHYNFPPFSVGSVGRYLSPSRREIGHGTLGEKALQFVLPSEQEFPYTIRVVSEILESNGSSSQATICSSSMALMSAGVPLKSLVAGIAMGLVIDDKNVNNYTILSDIEGLEDHEGDMDFKIAGTKKGITAVQMDIKIKGINLIILEKILKQSKINRIEILDHMEKIISKPRKQVSKYAPKVKMISVNPEKIRDIIGSGGKIINHIIEKHDNVKIDIEQDGTIYIMHCDLAIVEKTANYIENFAKEIKVGDLYKVKILRFINDKIGRSFGAIAEIYPGVEGLIHISKLSSHKRINKMEDMLTIGQIISVKCIQINERGQIDLSVKDV